MNFVYDLFNCLSPDNNRLHTSYSCYSHNASNTLTGMILAGKLPYLKYYIYIYIVEQNYSEVGHSLLVELAHEVYLMHDLPP